MKKIYFLLIVACIMLLSSCGPRRYRCGGNRRCITDTEKKQKTEDEKKLPMATFYTKETKSNS